MAFKPDTYEFDTAFKEGDVMNAWDVHTTPELLQHLHRNPKTEIGGSVLVRENNQLKSVRINNRETFLEAARTNQARFKESDDFGMDSGSGAGLVGAESIPLLGGPFHKQLYLHDYLRMNGACFYAYNHDPAARRVVEIISDFTLGRGMRIDCDNKIALSLIRAFEEVNDLYGLMLAFAPELSIYGETMLWELPAGDTKIGFQLRPGQEVPKGLIPRYRLIDPSCIWEIVTYPEDITRKLFYQWVSPTQYQLYTGSDGGSAVPSTKFIFQQIPAGQVIHTKINSVSNEKRGRSDLFPALGYMKRLRDSVNYSIVSMQKQAAWSIDTTIKGSQSDIDAYVEATNAQGTLAPAGSEFVHTEAVKREYLANGSGRSGSHETFDWVLSMIATATGIPLQYFGTHLSNSGTRASALVSTEPVAKKFEMRQKIYERAIREMVRRTLNRFGLPSSIEFEITFPEIVTQDRSQKLKDLAAAQMNGWISRARAAEIAAKELGVAKFDYAKEKSEIEVESKDAFAAASSQNPLSSPGTDKGFASGSDEDTDSSGASGGAGADGGVRGLSSQDRKGISDNDRQL